MIKFISFLFMITLVCIQCSIQKNSTFWVTKNLKTTYVKKGKNDEFELPLQLKGKRIQIQDSLLILTEVRRQSIGSTLYNEFNDTIILKQTVLFKKQKDNEYSLIYPGSEFLDCIHHNKDICFAGENFFKLLEVEGNEVQSYITSIGKHSMTKCILFIKNENQELVLFIENDFLLLFFSKSK